MFKQINQVKIFLHNSCIPFDANTEKDYFKPNEQLLSFGNNLISSEYTYEDDIQKQKEEINSMNFFNVNFNLSDREDSIPSNVYFIEDKLTKAMQKKETTKLGKKRKANKQVKEIKNKKHTASDDDNILRKIQVQFISFIINYSNDVVSFFVDDYKNNPCFKDVDYKQKKVVNHKNVESLKGKTIGEIIQFKITPKIKKLEKNENKKSLNKILEKCPSLQKYFEKKYLDLFHEYYYNENDIFIVDEKRIPLSEKTKKKTFSFLIKKKRNNNLKEKIKNVCVKYLIYSYKKMKKPNFVITT